MTDSECIFCQRNQLKIVMENELAAAFWDIHPVNPGHLLVIPKAHKLTFFDLNEAELLAINELLHRGKALIDQKFSPDGYNLGVNIGKYGGQTIMHCHIHLMPRYQGDVPDPTGGIRNGLPPAKI
ncbi:HIT family protein [Liquorilactobacillus sicerae]|uniref:HIT family protein n=1 Tax=Liquorilactobacillus sicerae TaxID=1416943 RepID=UPI0024800877|nr:HIT family protein [Liquorilactobacillus sicerae]